MRSTENLPEGYREYYSLDMQREKSKLLLVNGIALLISLAMVIPVLLLIPINTLWNESHDMGKLSVKLVVFLLLSVAYVVLHELVHGIAMKLCGTKKVKYGFTGMYAFAGSDDYYGKGAYVFIALAPVVLWGIVLAAASAIVSPGWFWVVYFIQITNISGAAGDLFVTVKFLRFPEDILIKDYGVGMTVYSKTEPKTK